MVNAIRLIIIVNIIPYIYVPIQIGTHMLKEYSIIFQIINQIFSFGLPILFLAIAVLNGIYLSQIIKLKWLVVLVGIIINIILYFFILYIFSMYDYSFM